MPKRIKKVEDVLRKAMQRGSARSHPYEAKVDHDILHLYHYGTLIFACIGGKIVNLGGYSSSDRDAISTAMSVCGIPGSVSNSKSYAGKGLPELNGWYIVR